MKRAIVQCSAESDYSDYWDYLTHPFKHVTYNPYSNSCIQLPSLEDPGRHLRKTFVSNGDEMYALMSEPCVREHLFNMRVRDGGQICRRKHTSFLTKYKPETNSWRDVSSFDHLDLRQDFCIVANDNFIYFIGGIEWTGDNQFVFLSDVDRYDLSRNKWDKVAEIQSARKWAQGAAVNEKIYLAGGIFNRSRLPESCKCEVYDETTNEWQFITSFRIGPGRSFETLLAVDGELYASSIIVDHQMVNFSVRLECYKPEENDWDTKTEVTARRATPGLSLASSVCSMRIFKGFFNILPFDGNLPGTTQPSLTSKKPERKCSVM